MEDSRNNTPDDKNYKKKKIAVTGFIIFVVICAITLYFYLDYKATHISTDDAYVDGRIYPVAPRIPGTVKAVYVDHNQIVRKGDLLLEIDPADYGAKLNEAVSSADAEAAKLTEIEANAKTTAAMLELKEANMRQAVIDMKRAETLLGKGAISKERYDRAKTGYDVAAAEVRAARQQLRQAESGKISQSSKISERRAKQQTEELNMSYTKIYAPADGMVTKKNVEPGNRVQVGQPLMAIVALDDIWITANFKETQIEKIRPGQKVKIDVDTYSGATFDGKVDSIMAGTGAAFSLFPPENATGNYVKIVQRIPVKIVLDQKKDSSRILRVGMSVEPTIIVD
jgi:membrane fusion protein, multidrug efflux system